jgi:hypothetical protein
MKKVNRHSGLGEVTAMSDGILGLHANGRNLNTYAEAMQETEDVIYDVTKNLLAKTGLHPSQVTFRFSGAEARGGGGGGGGGGREV